MKFKLLHGKHSQEGVKYVKGEIVETEMELDKLFVNKFVCIDATPMQEPPKKPEIQTPKLTSPSSSNDEEVESQKDETSSSNIGDGDVTKEFPTAIEYGLKVICKDNWFEVVDEDGERQHDKKLRRSGVEKLLASLED